MTIFNQQGQHVQNQYNAGGDMHIDIKNNHDLEKHLEQLILMVKKSTTEGTIDTATADAVKQELQRASTGEKKSIVEHLSKAKDILKGISAAEGLVNTLKALITSISNWLV